MRLGQNEIISSFCVDSRHTLFYFNLRGWHVVCYDTHLDI